MAKYQQYAEYKDSGVEWLGKVPKQWSISPLKLYIDTRKGVAFKSADFTDTGIRVVKASDIKDKTIQQSDVFLPTSFSEIYPKAVLKTGDIVISTVGSTPDVKNSAVGQIGMLPAELNNSLLNQNTVIFSPRRNTLENPFLFYLIQTNVYREHLDLNAHGTANQASLNVSDMLNFTFALPFFQEQTQIANFLDHETAQIDTLIEKQQALIQLLKEKRQAVISHAVTKGLNPNVPMKDSGVEWVETIPEHWKAYKLGYCASVGNGATPSRDNLNFWKDGSISWLNSSKINDVIIHEADQFITPLAKLKTSVHPVQKNDILMAITGEGQTRGRVAICKLDATINQHLACIRITNEELGYEYLYYWLNSNYERIRFESSGAGSTKGAITCGNITSYPVLIPPKKEQQEIVEYLKEKNEVFDTLMNSAEQAIQLMQERRTALISAAVTGKIDVRGWDAH